jgi:hypothetical protein
MKRMRFFLRQKRTFLLFFLVPFYFCSCKQTVHDKIEYIDMSFTCDNWHVSSIRVQNGSFNYFFNSCDSIAFVCGVFDTAVLNSINKITDSFIGNLIDTVHSTCPETRTYYQLIIKREQSKIIYFGNDCNKNGDFTHIRDILVDYVRNSDFEYCRPIKFESKFENQELIKE